MAARGFLNARIFLFKRNSLFSKVVLTRAYLVDSSYASKHAFRLHFPVGDRNNNCENADEKYYSYSSLPYVNKIIHFKMSVQRKLLITS